MYILAYTSNVCAKLHLSNTSPSAHITANQGVV